jgi:hypothetical protein
MDYSAKQEQGHTDVGVTAEMAQSAMPATPDVAGEVGPPAQTQVPWAGRFEASRVAFDGSAGAFTALAREAQSAPGRWVNSSETAGPPNTGPAE